MEFRVTDNPGYEFCEIVGETARWRLIRGRTTIDSQLREVLIRSAVLVPIQQADRQNLRHDFAISTMLSDHSPYILRPVACENRPGSAWLVLEAFSGVPLAKLSKVWSVGEFLPVAIEITKAVSDIHQQLILHRQLSPHNILIDPSGATIKIINFGLATAAPREGQGVVVSQNVGEHWAYISPEQTGRMNRAIDFRSDLYSLGVIFYQMLTGRLPFEAQDPLGWLHAHMAASPAPMSGFRAIPPVIESIVSKLMSKMAEDRYQTAIGLQKDLEQCWSLFRKEADKIDTFNLATQDKSPFFQMPETIYGRDREIAELHERLRQVGASGRTMCTMISGYSGIGKSRLARELVRPLTLNNGHFVSGKFDIQHRGVPYFTFSVALRELLLWVLSGPPGEVSNWRRKIAEVLGKNMALVSQLIPDLRLILGLESEKIGVPATAMPLGEAMDIEQRLHGAIQDMIGLFATPQSPVVLFLDDLQWADAASLKLIEALAGTGARHALYLVGAYRSNEINPHHPVSVLLERLRAREGGLHEIQLGPLKLSDVTRLVADTLKESESEVAPLARLLNRKTGGNPFFLNQLIQDLVRNGQLHFDVKEGVWRWHPEEIEKISYTDNVIDLMTEVIGKLPSDTKNVLMVAAALGNQFNVAILMVVKSWTYERLIETLREAARTSLILPSDGVYTFLHDRVQQAAYSLLSDSERSALHWRIGWALIEQGYHQRGREALFEVVSQFNNGISEIETEDEKDLVIELNLRAARNAKSAGAFKSASDYLRSAMALLPIDAWKRNRERTFELFLETAEIEYLTGEFAAAERHIDELMGHARKAQERASVFLIRLNLCTTKGEMQRAVSIGVEALKGLGLDFSAVPSQNQVLSLYNEVWEAVGDRHIGDLVDLPVMSEPNQQAIMRVLSGLLLPAHFAGGEMLRYVTAKMTLITIRHGVSPESVTALVWFAVTLVDRGIGRYLDGFLFGKLSYTLMEKHGFESLRSQVCLFFGDIVNFYTEHLIADRPYIEAGFAAGVAEGDLLFACYHCNHLVTNMLVAGDNLAKVKHEIERSLEFVRAARDTNIEDILLSQKRFVMCLTGETWPQGSFNSVRTATSAGHVFEEADFEARIEKSEMVLMRLWYYIHKMSARYIYGDIEGAVLAERQARKLIEADPWNMESTLYFFFAALTMVKQYESADERQRPKIMALIEANRRQLRVWADVCPVNFANRYYLLEAEVARIKGERWMAMELYEKALRSAEDGRFFQNSALIAELAARFFAAEGLPHIADAYYRKAIEKYSLWGARGKVDQLLTLSPPAAGVQGGLLIETTSPRQIETDDLDIMAVTKAQRAISSELAPEALNRLILQIAMESAGARKGAFIRNNENDLWVVVRNLDGQVVDEEAPLGQCSDLPHSIINYVFHSKSPVLLDNAAESRQFAKDAYLMRELPKSILCLPIIRRDECVAVLYLENDLATRSFTGERVALLELLAAQVTVSLDNATLFDAMRNAVRTRDEFLAIASHELRTPLSPVSIYLQTLQRMIKRGDLAKVPEETLLELLETANSSVQRLALLIDQLLDVSRITSGRLQIQPESTNMTEVVNRAVDHLKLELQNAKCPVEVEVGPDMVGSWDPMRIEQVLTNLLANAIKYAPGKPIRISAAWQGSELVLRVRDQGLGIAAEDLKRLFRPFERAVGFLNISGFGLGLYIVKLIVEAHGGWVAVESQLGQGTTFTVTLPKEA